MTSDLRDVPYLDHYFGPWAIQPAPFHAMVARFRSTSISAHMAGPRPQQAREMAGRGYTVQSGIAVIELRGVPMKHISSLTLGTSTVEVRRAVRGAAADDSVQGILLLIDSPGGTVAGTSDLAIDVADAAARKPVAAQIIFFVTRLPSSVSSLQQKQRSGRNIGVAPSIVLPRTVTMLPFRVVAVLNAVLLDCTANGLNSLGRSSAGAACPLESEKGENVGPLSSSRSDRARSPSESGSGLD